MTKVVGEPPLPLPYPPEPPFPSGSLSHLPVSLAVAAWSTSCFNCICGGGWLLVVVCGSFYRSVEAIVARARACIHGNRCGRLYARGAGSRAIIGRSITLGRGSDESSRSGQHSDGRSLSKTSTRSGSRLNSYRRTGTWRSSCTSGSVAVSC